MKRMFKISICLLIILLSFCSCTSNTSNTSNTSKTDSKSEENNSKKSKENDKDKKNAEDKKNKDTGLVWTIDIDDTFEGEVKMPEMPGYLVKNSVKLFAQKVDDVNDIYGEYKGILAIEAVINEESFKNAMNSLDPDLSIIDFSSDTNIQSTEVTFTIELYNEDVFDEANAAYKLNDSIPIVPLVKPLGMAISTYQTTAYQTTEITTKDGGGAASGGGLGETIPFLIRLNSNENATLYLPRMLMGYQRNYFNGKLYQSQRE